MGRTIDFSGPRIEAGMTHLRVRTSHRVHSTVLALLAALAVAACRSGERNVADSATASERDSATPRAPNPGQFAIGDFRHLRWLDGSWRGALPEGGFFFETYRLVDDSTIAMYGFPDSTFRSATDSARISLRGTTIVDEGTSARWVATRLDSSTVHFAPERGGSNGFMWERESPDRWLATLRSRDRQGATRTIMYPMQRFARPGSPAGAAAVPDSRTRP